MKPLALALGLGLSAWCAPLALAESSAPVTVETRSIPFSTFAAGSSQVRFGKLEFVGGFELRSRASKFGQMSAFRFTEPGGQFIGVSDHGYWFFGSVERDGNIPVGVSDFRKQPIVDAAGNVISDKHYVDAEGLDVHGGVATVSFERLARVTEYPISAHGAGAPLHDLDFLIPRRELRYNSGMETVARGPAGSALQGARIVIAERSIDQEGNIFASVLEGPRKGIFKVKRRDDFDVTDGVFLPDGDLLLLERRFTRPISVGMRMRRIDGSKIKPGAVIDGEVLIDADLSARIDNMEAIDVWQREDGELVVSVVSDDNQSFLQRTLYLEFVLRE